MRIKPIGIYIITCTVLILLFTAGCENLFNNPLKDAETEGTLSLQLNVPNYQTHSESSDTQSRIISPDSRYLEIYADTDGIVDGEDLVYSNDLSDMWSGDENCSSNGFFYTTYSNDILLPSGTYTIVAKLYDDSPGWPGDSGYPSAVLVTTGEATDVTIGGGSGSTVNLSLTPPSDMFTPLTLGTTDTGIANGGSMTFFTFEGTAGYSYKINLVEDSSTGTFSKPDVYVFTPDGKRTGTVLANDNEKTNGDLVGDILQTEGVEGLPFVTYDLPETGAYYIGIYGWEDGDEATSDNSAFEITVSQNATAYQRPTESDPDPGTVEYYVDAAITNMENQNFESAIGNFSEALIVDNAESSDYYGMAKMGYHMLYTFQAAVDPDMVDLAKNNLGIADYPSTMNELISGEWMQSFTNPDGDPMLFPRITGQSDIDGDGVVGMQERMLALIEFFVNNNTGVNTLSDTVLNTLNGTLDTHIQQIRNLDPDMNFVFKWDMMYESPDDFVSHFDPWDGEANYSWPVDEHGNPIEIRLGKADLMLLASYLEMYKSYIYMTQVYNYDTGSQFLLDAWSTYNWYDGTWVTDNTSSVDSPFLTDFLQPRTTWSDSIADSKAAMLQALTDAENALYGIHMDRTVDVAGGEVPFLLSSQSELSGIQSQWQYMRDMFQLTTDEMIWRIKDSINDPEVDQFFYMPMSIINPETDVTQYLGNWPTALDVENDYNLAINFGRIWDIPFSNILELNEEGEPVYYDFVTNPANFTVISDISDPSVSKFAYIRVPDVTFGGLTVQEMMSYLQMYGMVDDPDTRVGVDINYSDSNDNNRWDWDDANSNGVYDSGEGEYIWSFDYIPAVEGVVDMNAYNVNTAFPDGNPISYYETETASLSEISAEWFVDKYVNVTSDGEALLAALNEFETDYPDDVGTDMYLNYFAFLRGSEFFSGVPYFVAWQSFTSPGTTYTMSDGSTLTSHGSIWWTIIPRDVYE